MPKGKLWKDEEGNVWLNDKRLKTGTKSKDKTKRTVRDLSPFADDFSPILSEGDSLWVAYSIDKSMGPCNINLTIPDHPVPYTFVPILLDQSQEKRLFPVRFHDGRECPADTQRLSGKMNCEI